MVVIIKNDFLETAISTRGAEMQSIKTADGTEQLHQPDEFWGWHAPVLFPICGAPKDGKIRVNGEDFPMEVHGFVRFMEFEITEETETAVTMKLEANAETLKAYPYAFEFYVSYSLNGNSVDVGYKMVNKSEGTAYFSFGSHEGYLCPDGLDNYEIHLEKSETQKPFIYETLRTPEEYLGESEGHSVLKLGDKLFENAVSVLYENIDSDFVVLRNKKDGREIKITFEGNENLCIWTKPYSGFICIEPWCGIADFGKAHADISEKRGIHSLDKGGSFERHHVISFG